jgi:hypothetical protein
VSPIAVVIPRTDALTKVAWPLWLVAGAADTTEAARAVSSAATAATNETRCNMLLIPL